MLYPHHARNHLDSFFVFFYMFFPTAESQQPPHVHRIISRNKWLHNWTSNLWSFTRGYSYFLCFVCWKVTIWTIWAPCFLKVFFRVTLTRPSTPGKWLRLPADGCCRQHKEARNSMTPHLWTGLHHGVRCVVTGFYWWTIHYFGGLIFLHL